MTPEQATELIESVQYIRQGIMVLVCTMAFILTWAAWNAISAWWTKP